MTLRRTRSLLLPPQAVDRPTAAHILRRTGFGASAFALPDYIGRDAGEIVDEIVDSARSTPLPAPPDWKDEVPPGRGASDEERAEYAVRNREHVLELVADWLALMPVRGLRERMTLFWHNHFVTGIQTYQSAALGYRYLDMLRRHALGNFRDFVRAVGIDASMLIYLNGAQNRVGTPNENYARELLELFTMGILGPDGGPNYVDSQAPPGDVQEIARALTGWTISLSTLTVEFQERLHDRGEKTIFGRTGDFGYDDVVDLIFVERSEAVARFVCRKLYQEFVYEEPDEASIGELAAEFVASDFEIATVLRTLLKSDAFYDERIVGARIKSPVEAVVGLLVSAGIESTPESLRQVNRFLALLSQELLDPPNVAGWPGHHNWIDTTSLPLRWLAADLLISGRGNFFGANAVALAEALTDPTWDSGGARLSPFFLPVAIAEHLLAVPLEDVSIENVSDEFAGDLETFPVPEEVRSSPPHMPNLAKIFLAGAPWYEWHLEAEGAATLLQAFVRYLSKLPEFELE